MYTTNIRRIVKTVEALKYAITVIIENTVGIVKDLKYALTTVVKQSV